MDTKIGIGESTLARMVQGDDQAWKQFAEILLPKIRHVLTKLIDDKEKQEDAALDILTITFLTLGMLAQVEGQDVHSDTLS